MFCQRQCLAFVFVLLLSVAVDGLRICNVLPTGVWGGQHINHRGRREVGHD